MSNILDEIIAVTENYRHYNDGLPKQLSNTTNVPISSVQNQPFPNAFAPSPRGVQDDLVPYSLLHAPSSSHSYYEQDNHSTSFQPSLIEDHSQPSCNPSLPITSSTQVTDINPTSLIPTSQSQHHHSNSQQISYQIDMPIISNNQTWSPHQHSHVETNQKQSHTTRLQYSQAHKSSKRSLDQIDVKHELETKHSTTPTKRAKRETSVVMPPSAKSILERREKAIREGRRKDAKLSETERRILRRLRNRESAERCRQRREEQAKELQERIKTMQLENNRLVEMAGHYKQTIQRLENMIADFTAKRQHEQKAN